jgi:hypothetical protein
MTHRAPSADVAGVTETLSRVQAALSERYMLDRELGRGGMAVVYVAQDIRHRRQVAIKVFDAEIAGAVGHERFLREIQVAAHLTHPHILPLYDSGEAEGLIYYVMPRIEGETLRERMSRTGQLSLEEALRIAREVADALAYAHRHGLVHRDIKPENIMMSSGHALVMDFGICRAVGEAGLTRAGLPLGTPLYMSPEQWTTPERVDGRSDIYSLACVLYEMLVGEPPFTGGNAALVMARHLQQEVPSIRVARADVPESINAVLMRALAKVPAERYPTADDFAAALSAALTLPTLTTTMAVPPQPTAPRRFRPWHAAALLALLVAAGVLTLQLLRDAPATATSQAVALSVDRVVVEPLVNRTGDPALDDLGRMAADWITEGLHRAGVDVVPSPTALSAAEYVRGEQAAQRVRDPISALADEVGAGIVVTGAYYVTGDTIQFQAQITNARTKVLMSSIEPVGTTLSMPTDAIREVRNRVMGSLALTSDERLSLPGGAANQPPKFDAYRAFSRGLDHYIRNDNRAALEEFYTAVELDSTFTVALLYAAFCHSNLGEHASVDSLTQRLTARSDELTDHNRYWLEYMEARVRGHNQRALTSIRQAAQLAPSSKASYNRAWVAKILNRPAEALEALEPLDPERGAMRGWFPYWEVLTDALHRQEDHRAELDAAQRARALYPERAEARRFELDALAALGRTRDIDARLAELETSPAPHLPLGAAMAAVAIELRSHGHAADARALFQRALEWYRTHPGADTPEHQLAYAEALHAAGHWGEARTVLQQLTSAQPELLERNRAWLGILAAGNGARAEALVADAWLAGQNRTYSFGFAAFQRARIAALLNDRARTVDLVRNAFAQGFAVPRHPDINFDAVRGYEPIEELFRVRE